MFGLDLLLSAVGSGEDGIDGRLELGLGRVSFDWLPVAEVEDCDWGGRGSSCGAAGTP